MPIKLEIPTIKNLRLDGKLIPFIGSGFSVRFNLPSWSELIDIIAQELDFDPEVFKLNGDFPQLAEYCVAMKGSIGHLRSLMDKKFTQKDEDILKSSAHMALVDLKFPLIYTTNFDNIIERAFGLKKVEHHVITNIVDIATAPSEGTHIVKFHGTFTDDNSLVITETNYFDRMDFESALDIKLRADILGKTMLFIGYSLNDPNIRYMLYKLHKLRQRDKMPEGSLSAIMTTFSPGEVQRELLSRWDVSTVELDSVDKNKSIDEFLEQLK